MASQLVPLPEIERLSPACIRILGGNPGKFTLQGTNTYLLGTGRERLLVDTAEGRPSWEAAVARTLAAEQATLAAVLITHWHPDHVGGIAQVRRLVPGVPVYQNQEGQPATDTHADGQLDIYHGQEFTVEGVTLRALHTPGHAANHMAFVVEEASQEASPEAGLRVQTALVAGDNVLGQGTAVFEDLGVYLQSLQAMRRVYEEGLPSRRPTLQTLQTRRVLYPGHGPVVEDGPAKIAEYLAHRQQREDQVLQLLRTPDKKAALAAASSASASALSSPSTLGPASASSSRSASPLRFSDSPPPPPSLPPPSMVSSWSAAELASVIYADIRKDLLPAAQKGLVQILDKLEGQGSVVRDKNRQQWTLRERSPL